MTTKKASKLKIPTPTGAENVCVEFAKRGSKVIGEDIGILCILAKIVSRHQTNSRFRTSPMNFHTWRSRIP